MIKVQNIVAVVGSRGIQNSLALVARLEALHKAGELTEVVSGGATGVDSLAAAWARAHGVPCTELRPDYRTHWAGAPHVRNTQIAERAGRILLVWDGQSRGTLSTWRAAQRLGRRCEWLAAPAPGPTGTAELAL